MSSEEEVQRRIHGVWVDPEKDEGFKWRYEQGSYVRVPTDDRWKKNWDRIFNKKKDVEEPGD